MESSFKGPADTLIPVARILPWCFYADFCPHWLPAPSQPSYLLRPHSIRRQQPASGSNLASLCSLWPARHGCHCLTPLSARRWCKSSSIPWSGEQMHTSSSSSATQGCQLDKCVGHPSSRKPSARFQPLVSLCSAEQPSGSSKIHPGSAQGHGGEAVRSYAATIQLLPELTQTDCFWTRSLTHTLKTQFCPLVQTQTFQGIQGGRLYSWDRTGGFTVRRPTLGTAREISGPFWASFSPWTATEGAEGRGALA